MAEVVPSYVYQGRSDEVRESYSGAGPGTTMIQPTIHTI